MRDDVDYEEVVGQALHELSTPELYGPLTAGEALAWIGKLRA